MVSPRARQGWRTAAWVVAVFATVLNGVVVGYGAVWFQLFGDTADSEDYRVSAGGYAAAAAVLALAVPAVLAHRAPRWLAWFAGAAAAVLALLALGSAETAGEVEQASSPINGAWDGVGGVLWAPWTWVLVVLGVRGAVRLLRGRAEE